MQRRAILRYKYKSQNFGCFANKTVRAGIVEKAEENMLSNTDSTMKRAGRLPIAYLTAAYVLRRN